MRDDTIVKFSILLHDRGPQTSPPETIDFLVTLNNGAMHKLSATYTAILGFLQHCEEALPRSKRH